VVEGHCACGFDGPSLTGFGGRRACLFSRPDGTTVDAWQLAWLLKQHPLRSFSLVQIAADRFRLELAPDEAAGAAALSAGLEAALTRMGWTAPQVEPGSLAPPPAKPEPFRCELPPARPDVS
jgi:phenylacetate-CoA ligase